MAGNGDLKGHLKLVVERLASLEHECVQAKITLIILKTLARENVLVKIVQHKSMIILVFSCGTLIINPKGTTTLTLQD